MRESIEKQYNQFAGEYSENLEVQDEVGNRRFYEMLSTVDVADKKILDVGCGDGTDLANLVEKGAGEVFGIDPSEEFVKSAREKNPDSEIVIGKGEHLPFADASFRSEEHTSELQSPILISRMPSSA